MTSLGGRGSPGSTSLGGGVRWEGGGAHQAVLHLEGGEMGRGGAHQAVLHLERG